MARHLTTLAIAAAALCCGMAANAAPTGDTATEFALSGPVDGARLRAVADSLPDLRSLDLSRAVMTELPAYSLAATSIEHIILPESLETIAEGALAGTPLRTLTIPQSVTSIGAYALSGCASLETIDGGSSLRVIGTGAMRRCPALESVPFPATLDSIAPSALRGSAITEADLSRCTGLRTIGEWALAGCSSLESVSLPPHLSGIGRGAFFGDRSLNRITMYAGIDSISDFAFAHASALEGIDAYGLESVPELGAGTWHGVDRPSVTLTVAEAMLHDFAATPGWQEFNIVAYASVHAPEADTAPAMSAHFAGDRLLVIAPPSARAISVYGTDGRLCIAHTPDIGVTTHTIDASELPAGLYIVAATTADGSMSAVKARK